MPALFITLTLLLAPLPGLPRLPSGAELRLVSPDLKRVFAVFVVRESTVWPLRRPVVWGPGQRLAVVVRVGRRVYVYPGLTTEDDVLLVLPEGKAPLKALLAEVYHLRWPSPEEIERYLKNRPKRRRPLGPHPDRRRRP